MKNNTKKLALAGVFCALAVVGSLFHFLYSEANVHRYSIWSTSCVPSFYTGYGVAVAFVASLIRNLLGLGSLLAFPGSMIGALLCGLMYWKVKKIIPTLIAEVFGTGILGGLCAYPMAILFMGKTAGDIAFYAYVIPFLVSTAGGAIISGLILAALDKSGALKILKGKL